MLIAIVWKGSTEKNCSEQIYVHFMVKATKKKEKKKNLYEMHLSFPTVIFQLFK